MSCSHLALHSDSAFLNIRTDCIQLPGRQQYKHVLFGPSGINPHEFEAFPSVRDAIRAGDWERAQQEVERVSQMVTYAAQKLNN